MFRRSPLRRIADFYRSLTRKSKTSAIVLAAGIALLGAGYAMEVQEHNKRVDIHNAEVTKRNRAYEKRQVKARKKAAEEKRKVSLEKMLFQRISDQLNLDKIEICTKQRAPFVEEDGNYFLIVHGHDKRPRLMKSMKNDARAIKGLVSMLGYKTVEICPDIHDKVDFLDAGTEIAEVSTSGSDTGSYFSAHGQLEDDKGYIQFKSGSSFGTSKTAGSSETNITDDEINSILRELKGEALTIIDICHNLDDLYKGTQVGSSDKYSLSYFASNVNMSYFPLAFVYTMLEREDTYTMRETAYHLMTRDPSLPSEILQFMEDNPDSFSTITISENIPSSDVTISEKELKRLFANVWSGRFSYGSPDYSGLGTSMPSVSSK